MATEKISTSIIADDAVTAAKIPDDAITLAKIASGTDGQIITYDASGNPTAVGPGTAGQVITSAGAGAPPTFSTKYSYETHFYFAGKANTAGPEATYGNYHVSFNVEGSTDVHVNGVIPYNFVEITQMRYWALHPQLVNSNNTNRAFAWAYNISANDASYSGDHSQGMTVKHQNFDITAGDIRYWDLMATGASSSDYFENNVAAGDIFAMVLEHRHNADTRAIGVQVTYKVSLS